MPELPEVESVRRSLEPRLVGRRIDAAELRRRDVLVMPGDPAGGFGRRTRGGVAPAPVAARPAELAGGLLRGATVAAVLRKGKRLALVAGDGRALLVHLGMTGRFFVHDDPAEPEPPHGHAVWRLGPTRVVFCDPRRFGGLWALGTPGELAERWAELGPDAATLRAGELAAALAGRRRPIKAALLDQGLIAGVGNIYADEALHRAGVHPASLAAGLDAETVRSLAGAIRAVLRAAIARGGSTLRDYADATGRAGDFQRRHAVYGRAGEPCRGCGRPLESALVAQRTTVWCGVCQPLLQGVS